MARRRGGGGGVETVEDEEVALGIVQSGESGDALEMIHGSEGVHLVVFDVVPGDIPAGAVGLDASSKIHGAKVIADGGETGHQGQVGAADREDEVVVGVVSGDDAMDLGGGDGEGVVGGVDIVEGLTRVG